MDSITQMKNNSKPSESSNKRVSDFPWHFRVPKLLIFFIIDTIKQIHIFFFFFQPSQAKEMKGSVSILIKLIGDTKGCIKKYIIEFLGKINFHHINSYSAVLYITN